MLLECWFQSKNVNTSCLKQSKGPRNCSFIPIFVTCELRMHPRITSLWLSVISAPPCDRAETPRSSSFPRPRCPRCPRRQDARAHSGRLFLCDDAFEAGTLRPCLQSHGDDPWICFFGFITSIKRQLICKEITYYLSISR